ncbi:hypothetical protein [Thiopseudomonas alkaliphila]|uniref:hypothetical protein n=1 Tax=Thiopseudomonas alkaliphila TaxID=1697053 RepID=UPI002574E158|nr:hypothetical protein [Thiopseudomonas alkaliphila]MDM1717376.1 hypothetical protein [Thiopseudomonas alkaliphila]
MKKSIKIKDYARSIYFKSLEELKIILEHDYVGRVITVHLTAKSGKLMPPCRYVITDEGVQELCGRDLKWDRLALALNQ